MLTHAATSAMSSFVCLDTITKDLELMAREQGGDDMKKSGGDVCGGVEVTFAPWFLTPKTEASDAWFGHQQ
jgi:hypothetical protein